MKDIIIANNLCLCRTSFKKKHAANDTKIYVKKPIAVTSATGITDIA